jgi:hypothetical protein
LLAWLEIEVCNWGMERTEPPGQALDSQGIRDRADAPQCRRPSEPLCEAGEPLRIDVAAC